MNFMIVVLMFSVSPIVDSISMNYSCVVLGGTLSFAVAYYYIPKVGGKFWFEGPVRNIPGGNSIVDTPGEKTNAEEADSK
jgi:hypothetical protein